MIGALSSMTAPWFPLGGGEWAAVAAAYLLGSVPFGLVLVRLIKGVDLRKLGSGNIGATNAMRAAGKPAGVAVFMLDFLKGFAPVLWLAPRLAASPERVLSLQIACGGAAVLGHCFPVYLRFRGGKGVSTGCGALVAIDPIVFGIGALAWLATLALTRFTGLASIVMGLTFAAAAWFRTQAGQRELVWGAALLALLIVVRHRANIARMLAGTEPRAGAKRAARLGP
jgi:glycerol-3-phosphate acyltransferase PlsY